MNKTKVLSVKLHLDLVLVKVKIRFSLFNLSLGQMLQEQMSQWLISLDL